MSVLGADHTTLPPVTDAASSATSFPVWCKHQRPGTQPRQRPERAFDEDVCAWDRPRRQFVEQHVRARRRGRAIVPPETGAAGSATSFLSGASTNIDQGLSLDSDQTGFRRRRLRWTTTPSSRRSICPCLAWYQIIAPTDNMSGLGDHAVASPINMSVLGADHTTLPPVTDAASSATSFLSGASTSDQALSPDSDQNGLLTKTSALGNDHAVNLSNNMSVLGVEDVRSSRRKRRGRQCKRASCLVQVPTSTKGSSLDSDQNGLLTKTSALGNDHAIDPSNNMSVLGVEHVIVPPETGAAGSATASLSVEAPTATRGSVSAAIRTGF